MLNLDGFIWTYKAKEARPGEVHQWESGPHVKTQQGWEPVRDQQSEGSEGTLGKNPKDVIEDLKDRIVEAAQWVVDSWEQDEEGYDEEFGAGGACDAIANEISDILTEAGLTVVEGGQEGDDHAFVVAHNGDTAYIVDIPPSVYETGGGYSWTKREGVTIEPEDIVVEEVDIAHVADEDERQEAREYWSS